MDVSRELKIVTSNSSPIVYVYACYFITLLVSNFYLDELYICALLLYTSITGGGMRNWWTVMTEEVGKISKCIWVMICTSEDFFRILYHKVLYLAASEH